MTAEIDWSKLPKEILENIFRRLDTKSNSQCSITCHRWKVLAQCVFFEKVSPLSKKKLIALIDALSVYQGHSYSSDFGQSPANLVKVMDCRSLERSPDLLKSLNENFPFLEVMVTENNETFHEELYRLLLEGMFACLKEIPTHKSIQPPPVELVLFRKNCLVRLELNITSLDDQIIQSIHLFSKLRCLKLHCGKEAYIERLLELLGSVPQLSMIDLDYSQCPERVSSPAWDLAKTQPSTNIKEIMITYLCCFSDKTLLYWMQNFPYLEGLVLRDCDTIGFEDHSNSALSVACVVQFIVHLFQMKKNSELQEIISGSFTDQIVAGVLDYVYNQKVVRFKNVEAFLKLTFQPDYPGSELEIGSDRKPVIHVRNYWEGLTKVCHLHVVYTIMANTVLTSHLELIKNIDCMDIKQLELVFWGFEELPSLYGPNTSSILDYALGYFAKLKKLHLIKVPSIISQENDYRFEEEEVPHGIEDIDFFHCILPENLFPSLSAKCLELKELSLAYCQYKKQVGGETPRYIPITMPYTCLQRFSILIKLDDVIFPYEKLFIRLTTKDKKPRYCKITAYNVPFPDAEIVFSEQDSTEAHYNFCLEDENCAVIDIHCEAVKNLMITAERDSSISSYSETGEVDYTDEELMSRWYDNICKSKEYFEEDY